MKTNQVAFATEIEINERLGLVVCLNTAITIKPPDGYEVLITENLTEAGVRLLASGKIKFPSTAKLTVLSNKDSDFRQFRLAELTEENSEQIKDAFSKSVEEYLKAQLNKLIAAVENTGMDSELMKLLAITQDEEIPLLFTSLWLKLSTYLSAVDMEKLKVELEAAGFSTKDLPEPEAE